MKARKATVEPGHLSVVCVSYELTHSNSAKEPIEKEPPAAFCAGRGESQPSQERCEAQRASRGAYLAGIGPGFHP